MSWKRNKDELVKGMVDEKGGEEVRRSEEDKTRGMFEINDIKGKRIKEVKKWRSEEEEVKKWRSEEERDVWN